MPASTSASRSAGPGGRTSTSASPGRADRWTACAAYRSSGDEVTTLDLTDRFCDTSRCPAVIGGVLVYSERSHMTATYATSLSPFLADRLARVLDGV